jgi:septum formation protein
MTGFAQAQTFILASQSKARAALLTRAGLVFETRPVHADETALIESLGAEGASPREIADALAELKALKAASAAPRDMIVLGADQILDCDGRIFEKPGSPAAARAHLRALRGKRHTLHSAVAAAKNGAVIWRHIETARLTMRDFTDGFLDAYLAVEGEAASASCGGYRIEGPGLHLFARIDGEASTIQGLPLLPLLQFLRDQGVVAA